MNIIDIDLLRRLRRQNHLSLTGLGKIVNRNKSTIWRYEEGILVVPTDVLFKLADLYQVSIDSFRK